MAHPQSIPPVTRLDEDPPWDHAADVVVVGGGIAGMATVLNALDMGASAILLDKGHEPGGTSAKAAAGLMVPNNRYLRSLGQDDPKADFVRFLARVGRPLLYDPAHPTCGLPKWEHDLIELYWETSAAGMERLEALGALETMHIPEWPSYNDLDEDKRRFGRVVMTVHEGEMGNGATAIARMRATVEKLGGVVLRRHRVGGVYLNRDGAVVGVRVATGEGERSIGARKAVVFATGGFVHNEELSREHLGGMYPGGCAARTAEGDLIPIAAALGAPLLNMQSVWGAPVLLEQALARDPGLIANFAIPGDSIIEVNKYGRRVRNEKTTYNDRTQAHFAWDPTRAEYQNWLLFPVWDRRCAERFGAAPGMDTGNFIPPSGEPLPPSMQMLAGRALVGASASAADATDPWEYVVKGDTLDDLAAALDARLAALGAGARGVRLDGAFAARLRDTVEQFNGYARVGHDPDFRRGETSIETYFHGGRAEDNDLPNEMLFPLAGEGPYYATILAPGAIDTKGGPKVNRRLQVLDANDQPIAGLYGVGNCVASASGQAYWSGGSTYGPYVGFGYAAAQSAVAEPSRTI